MRYSRVDSAGNHVAEVYKKGVLDNVRRHPDGSLALRPIVTVRPENPEPRLFDYKSATFTSEPERTVETFALAFRSNAKAIMFDLVDESAEELRHQIMHVRPGHALEMAMVHEEALAVRDRAPTDQFLEGEYPHLEADIGITVNPSSDLPVVTLREAATVVINKRQRVMHGLAHLRRLRLEGKKAIRDAPNRMAAWAALQTIPWGVYDPAVYILGRSGFNEP